MGFRVIQISTSDYYDAYIATCWVAILVSFTMATIMMQFIKERRAKKGDRRQHNISIDFPDRRVSNRRA